MKPLYTATATAHGGREGHVKSSDGVIDLQLKMPKELGGPGGAFTNPEQLFAAGYAACFEGALRLVARLQKLPITDAHIRADVTIGKTDDGGFGLKAALTGRIAGLDREAAQKLMEAAHQVCPYSKATRNNIEVTLAVEEASA